MSERVGLTMVTRGRKIVFNPVPYETIEVSASITTEEDFEDEDGLSKWMDSKLTSLLEAEIAEVAKVTANPKSVVHDYRYNEE